MSARRESGLGENLSNLRKDFTNVIWRSGLVSLALFSADSELVSENEPISKVIISQLGGLTNLLFRGLGNYQKPEELKRADLTNKIESILVGLNPIVVYSILESFLPVSTKAVVITSLAFVNATMLFAGRRLVSMEKSGGGKDLKD